MSDQQHQARMSKLKAKVDSQIDQAQRNKGLLVVITGNGKGKSTSGFGTVCRAVGHGLTVKVAQFIKGDWPCGERELLQQHGVEFAVMATGFTWDTQDRQADTQAAQQVWQQVKKWLADESINLILLDELTYMLAYKYLDIDEVLLALENRPAMQHVIITGRQCHRKIIEIADTVSNIQESKHAFNNGIKAQKGIDW